MLEVLINYICALILAIVGYYVIKTITNNESSINKKTLLILFINSIIITAIHFINYTSTFIFSCIINIITYKEIFKINIKEAVLSTGMLMLVISVADIAFLPILMHCTSIKNLESNIYIYLISNICVFINIGIIIHIRFIKKFLSKIYKVLKEKELNLNIVFILFILLGISGSSYNVLSSHSTDIKLMANTVILIVLVVIAVIFANKQNNYNQLSDQYTSLFKYVQNFEEWIEKEQFIRHEYKNQLAVIYSLSNEKEVKDKVNDILKHTISIENDQIHLLKVLPKGGLRGLMYYKTSIAQVEKINVTIDVSIKDKGILSKLSKRKINELSKVLGIYYDNAIEAAKESTKKIILVEIYELKECVNIVISNTFNKKSIIQGMSKQGVSSKGAGRGNGLYFASKVINKNNWLKEKSEIIDNYYIETLTITKNTSK
jgi:two-component system sensor histidine kinase AgrC